MPSVSATRSISAPAGDVWTAIADIESAGRWNPAWSSIEITSTQRHGLGMTFRARLESGDAFEFEVVEWSRGERVAYAPIRGEEEAYAISLERHVFDIRQPDGQSTRVQLTAVASTRGIRGFFIGRFFWPGYQKRSLNDALEALATIFEPQVDAGIEEPAESD